VILPTISVIGNNETILTALLDTGAQLSNITPQALRWLGKNIKVTNLVRPIKIRGVVDNRSIIIEKCRKLRLLSIERTANFRLNCYVMGMDQEKNAKTIESIKSKGINISEVTEKRIFQRRTIDFISGANVVFDIIKDQRIEINDQTVAIKTSFGWVLNGETDSDGVRCNILHEIEILMREICANKKYPDQSNKTKEETKCDDHFKETTYFDQKHRVVVKMPLRSNCQLSGTRRIVYKRRKIMEAKKEQDNNLKTEYDKFMSEYLQRGEMQEFTDD
jgi:hypothetical protein